MSTDDDLLRATRIRRRIVPPAEPDEDALARDWTLSPADLAEIAFCRGAAHRRRFALQLCMRAQPRPIPRRFPTSPAEGRHHPHASIALPAGHVPLPAG